MFAAMLPNVSARAIDRHSAAQKVRPDFSKPDIEVLDEGVGYRRLPIR